MGAAPSVVHASTQLRYDITPPQRPVPGPRHRWVPFTLLPDSLPVGTSRGPQSPGRDEWLPHDLPIAPIKRPLGVVSKPQRGFLLIGYPKLPNGRRSILAAPMGLVHLQLLQQYCRIPPIPSQWAECIPVTRLEGIPIVFGTGTGNQTKKIVLF